MHGGDLHGPRRAGFFYTGVYDNVADAEAEQEALAAMERVEAAPAG